MSEDCQQGYRLHAQKVFCFGLTSFLFILYERTQGYTVYVVSFIILTVKIVQSNTTTVLKKDYSFENRGKIIEEG